MAVSNTLARPCISHGQADRVDIILTYPPFGGREEDGIDRNFPAHFRTKETAHLFLALFIQLLKNGGPAPTTHYSLLTTTTSADFSLRHGRRALAAPLLRRAPTRRDLPGQERTPSLHNRPIYAASP